MATGAYFGVNTESVSYKVLSYIQSDGNQYIDTGFKPNQNTKLVIDLQPNIPVYDEENFFTWWCIPFGAYTRGNNDDDSSFDICIENEQSEWAVNWSTDDPYGDTGTGYEVFSYTNNKRIAISLEKTKVTLDGDTRNWTTANIQSDITLYLFAEHRFDLEDPPSYAFYHTPMKLYSCQIYDNGTLVRDFVPCISSDNKVGLYDRIGGKFYSNAGSGTFTAGSLTGEEISSGGSTDNIARKIKNIYIGIDNKARKVKKAYFGVGGKARLFYSSFPSMPTSYTLIDTYASNRTITAPEDAWYQVELFGRSGAGGTAAAFVDTSYQTTYLRTAGAGGGGGGGAYCRTDNIKLNKGDTIAIVIGKTCTVTITSSTGETYSVMQCTTGSDGGNGTASGSGSYRGDGGAGGVASGGTVNQNGGDGEFGSYQNSYGMSLTTGTGGAGGASGYTGGRTGGKGGSVTITGSPAYESPGSAQAGFCKIYRGNTNV